MIEWRGWNAVAFAIERREAAFEDVRPKWKAREAIYSEFANLRKERTETIRNSIEGAIQWPIYPNDEAIIVHAVRNQNAAGHKLGAKTDFC